MLKLQRDFYIILNYMSIYIRTIIEKEIVIIEQVNDHIYEYISNIVNSYENVDSITILLYFEGYEVELLVYQNHKDV